MKVGRAVGTKDGLQVGDQVGPKVGTVVGTQVGIYVGERVGLKVGKAVGTKVGLNVGERVGLKVGKAVGTKVGLKVGEQVGLKVGKAVVGQRVGERVGLTDGEYVGDEVASSSVKSVIPVAPYIKYALPAPQAGAPINASFFPSAFMSPFKLTENPAVQLNGPVVGPVMVMPVELVRLVT